MGPIPPADVALEPADWAVATWRPREPRPRPTATPFDRGDCLARLRRAAAAQAPYAAPDWARAGLAESLSPEEAQFWFLAMTDPSRDLRHGALHELERAAFSGEVTRADARQRLRQRAGHLTAHVLVPLVHLFSPADLVELLLDDQLCVVDPYSVPHYQVNTLQHTLLDGFRRFVRPHLDEPALERMRQAARSLLPSSLWSQPTPPTLDQTIGYRLAPLLSMHRELASLVAGWSDDLFPPRGSYEEWRRSPREMVFGLGDPWLVEQHTRRLKLYLRSEADARAWLAHTETKALDWLAASIRAASGPAAHKLTEALCLVRSPAAARPLLELRLAGRSCPALRAWFETQPGHAVAGLLPAAAGRGQVADAARRLLGEVKRRGGRAVLEEHLAAAEPAAARRVRKAVLDTDETGRPPIEDSSTPPWLREAMMQLPPLPPGGLPDWLALAELPPLVVGGRALTDRHVRAVVRAVEACKLEAPAPLLVGLRAHAEAASREAFAWGAVEQWRSAGAPPRDEWVLHAVGFLGGDESALRLAAMARDASGVPGRRQAGRTLECLAAVGTPLALQQLTALGRQARSRPVREGARRLVEELARRRGLSRAELEDAAVPALGFDGDRGPTFDFGARRFEAVLAPGPRLLLRDGGGAVREDLPEPAGRDDPALARRAVAEWRLLRRAFKEAVKEQSARLEGAMVSGQRWTLRHFRDRVLGRPLLARLARLVLWGGYDERGRLTCTFRVNDEAAFVDADEGPVPLRDVNSVRVVHPIELGDPARQAWAAAWRDHELVPPFAQLGRRLFPLADDERGRTAITSYRGRRVPALTLAGLVRARDWEPAFVAGSRRGEAHLKAFRARGLIAVLHHRDVGPYAYPNHKAEQELHAAYFFRGACSGPAFDPDEALPLGEVPDLPRSEVQELLAMLFAKGRE